MDLPFPVVLGSKSPQRRRLLRRVITDFEVVDPDVDEERHVGSSVEETVRKLARIKAQTVARKRPAALVIGADTLVECEGEAIGKPEDRGEAVEILRKLVSHPHRVVTGICLIIPTGRTETRVVPVEIRMKRMSEREIERYVDEEDVMDRAGAYGLRELDENVEERRGSPTAVMGLPVEAVRSLLNSVQKRGGNAGQEAFGREKNS